MSLPGYSLLPDSGYNSQWPDYWRVISSTVGSGVGAGPKTEWGFQVKSFLHLETLQKGRFCYTGSWSRSMLSCVAADSCHTAVRRNFWVLQRARTENLWGKLTEIPKNIWCPIIEVSVFPYANFTWAFKSMSMWKCLSNVAFHLPFIHLSSTRSWL